ncbi:RNA-directed DNA polymerase [Geitlerinema sp. P-1104]|uniref:RNA-directed DNA polymerase n=1 Tax=Geitlerinema sp. P-1104 TaxID=2546230 RepID=UPI0014772DB4|nr:RNA-directed DNA polymerase [Geitlerinema sp. P-1104]NMG60866.1 RNA-directed DNA polymerase [Geitlerinema sp. P-1104]
MKRYGNLWPKIVDFENLLQAARQAQRGKRYRPNVLAFNHNLDQELLRLQAELIQQTYRPGGYRTFKIDDPKPRLISAAPYRDRVVHHALCNVIVPPLEQTFIRETYANRQGYGTHRALKRFTSFARTSGYILQCDLRKYFPSIDHEILKSTLRRKIKCPETFWLIDKIIDGSNLQGYDVDYFPGDNLLSPLERRRGLPIGNLTSQFFANLYLNGFDHFVKEQLKARKYLRYVDDFALFSDDRGFLVRAWAKIEAYLTHLRLRLHPAKSQLFETRFGANFVGFRVLPDRIRVRNDNLRRARLRCRQLQQDYTDGQQSLTDVVQRLCSWEAHLMHGDTQGLRQDIFERLIFHPPPEPLSLENSLPVELEMEF